MGRGKGIVMRLFSRKTPEQKRAAKAATERYKAARNAAESRRSREEDEEYYRLNDELVDAMDDPALPWHAKLWT